MKNQTSVRIVRRTALVFCAVVLVQFQSPLFAQTGSIQINPSTSLANPPIPIRSLDELDSLVSPIALYPDPLLSQVLVASSYPLEIVEAFQWLQQQSLTGVALQDAARQQNWDPSVEALVVFPDVLQQLSENIQWTTDLGNAFLAQQNGVMDAVQRMRSQAMASGNLRSNAQAVVTTQAQGPTTIVEIQPANPQIIYVPVYDPLVIWGAPGFYPYPVFRSASYVIRSNRIYYPAGGVFIGNYFSGWNGWGGWGWSPNWYGRTIVVNNNFFNRYGYRHNAVATFNRANDRTIWSYDPVHRSRVPYVNRQTGTRVYNGVREPAINRGPQATVRQARPSAAPVPGVSRPVGPVRRVGPDRAIPNVSRPPVGSDYRANRTPFQAAPPRALAPQAAPPPAARNGNVNRGPNGRGPNVSGGSMRDSAPPAQTFRGNSGNNARGTDRVRSEAPRGRQAPAAGATGGRGRRN